jgi:hypothetical protein
LKTKALTYRLFLLLLLVFVEATSIGMHAQNARQRRMGVPRDSLEKLKPILKDSLTNNNLQLTNQKKIEELVAPADTATLLMKADSTFNKLQAPKKQFIPDSNRALWLAMVFPGGGQIYNRKYWKLPIVYGGFVGCAYALSWNNKMYKDYSQAYLDIMDNDTGTQSYEDFIPPSVSIEGQEERFKEIFRKRKDIYRRQRDLSIFCFIGVYVLSIIDAYVDAELSNFDISKDLTLKVEPTTFNDIQSKKFNSVGLQCSLNF